MAAGADPHAAIAMAVRIGSHEMRITRTTPASRNHHAGVARVG
jgi:hypothetical protein